MLTVFNREPSKTTPREVTARQVLKNHPGQKGKGGRKLVLRSEGELDTHTGAVHSFPAPQGGHSPGREGKLQEGSALFMLTMCQGEAGDTNPGAGQVQEGSTQRDLRRHPGAEPGFRYRMIYIFIYLFAYGLGFFFLSSSASIFLLGHLL